MDTVARHFRCACGKRHRAEGDTAQHAYAGAWRLGWNTGDMQGRDVCPACADAAIEKAKG